MGRKIKGIFYIAAILLAAGCGKEEETENVFSDGILIEVEAPQTNGWNTEEITGTRSGREKAIEVKGKDGLDMEISTLYDNGATGTAEGEATTRWANMDDNIVFRVVAYKSATAAGISTSNYAGYGDYKLSGSTVQTVKSLVVPAGTYTFIFYSYGNSNAIAAFTNGSVSVPATNGQNFMTYVKPGVVINNIGSRYTLSGIVFKHHCARYRVQAIAQSGRMGTVTACAGTVTLPKHNATYTFTNGAFTTQATTGSINLTWDNPNAMSVYSGYIYLLPQTSANVTVKLNLTIGGKAFSNKSVTLSGLTLTANNTYYSNVSFTTTEGYIIGGALWAGGNLYYDGTFKIYTGQDQYTTARGHDFWRFGALYPTDMCIDSTPWAQVKDPCCRVSPTNSWRVPTITEYISLLKVSWEYYTLNSASGLLFDKILFFPSTGYFAGANPNNITKSIRGLYWSANQFYNTEFSPQMLDFVTDNTYPPTRNSSNHPDNFMTIRCVRAD